MRDKQLMHFEFYSSFDESIFNLKSIIYKRLQNGLGSKYSSMFLMVIPKAHLTITYRENIQTWRTKEKYGLQFLQYLET